MRQYRHGDTSTTAVIVGDEEARFWSKVDKRGPDECWPWLESSRDDSGYGIFYTSDGLRTRAHRWLLGHLRGKPLTREEVGLEDGCHHCDNPPCCNPKHLYVGTRKQNVGDAVERSRLWQLKVTHCPQGHPYEGDNLIERPGGARGCRTCVRANEKRRRAARDTCKNGHPLSGDNVLICKNGTRKCKTCDAARLAKRWANK